MRYPKLFTITLLGALAMAVLSLFIQRWQASASQGRFTGATLRCVFLDVGQGDAALLRLPSGENILIDAGPAPGEEENTESMGQTRLEMDAGKEVILPALKRFGVKRLDRVILSHKHLDHYGGLLSILKEVPVGEVVETRSSYSTPPYERLLRLIQKKRIRYRQVSATSRGETFGGAQFKFLGPRREYAETLSDANNNSLVVKVTYGSVSILFAGDIEQEAETDLSALGERLKSTVLKVAHHGSQTSSTGPFLDMVNPEVAVISCGRQNPFRHPHRGTLDRLSKMRCRLYRTDFEGSLVFETDGKVYSMRALEGVSAWLF